MRLQESIGTALLAQDVIVLGNKKEIDDTIESLLRVYDGVGDPWPGMSDVIGTLESARDSDRGEWVSPNLTERGMMLPDPGTTRQRRRARGGRFWRRSGTRSQRDDAPRTTEAQRREDGSYDPPPGYETWADFEADWPDDDDDIDVDTERVVDERDEYPDDWGGQLGATEGGTRSRMGDIGRAADKHRRSGASSNALAASRRDDGPDERFLDNDVIGDIRNRSLNDLYENDLISPEVDRYINEKLVPEGLGEGDPEWDYIMNEKIDELTMTRLGEKILEAIEEDFREGNQDWYRERFGGGGAGPDTRGEARGMRSMRVPAGRRGRGGVRARQREAATDRAAMPRGTGTRSRKHTRVHQQPGVDKFKDADGNLWTNLGTEENAQDIKEAIAEAAHFQLNRLMWGLAHNDLNRHATPQKSGSIHRAEGDPTPATGRVADRAHALEIGRIGYNESHGVAKEYFDKEVRDAPHNADKDPEWFKNYVFDNSDIADVESWVEKSVHTTAPGTQQKIKAQLQDIKTLRNMIEQYNETGGPGGGGDLDSFAFLEHLNPASRRKIFERASGPNRDRIPGSSGVDTDTGVAIGGAPAAWRGATTLHAAKDVREARTSKLGGGRRRSMHEWRKEMATRIMAPNEARRKRRRARWAAAGGPFAPSARAPDPTKLTWEERRAILKRKWRRATGRGNPGFEKRHAAIMKHRELHPLGRSTDRLVKGAGAKLEFPEYEEADRGLPVVSPRFREMLAGLAARKRELDVGDRKKKKKVGDVTKGETTFGREPTGTDHLIDDMYRNLAMMHQAQVVGDQGLADALLDPNVLVVMRGMGSDPQGRQFAQHYIDAPGRFIGNKSIMAHGLGDDWARPLDPASATRGSLYGYYGTGVLGLIDPKSFRTIDMAKMIDIRDEHKAIEKSIAKVVTESTEGSHIADVVRKTPPDDLAKQIRHRLDADQTDKNMRLPNRSGQRDRVHEQAGRRSFGGYNETGGTYEMDRETTPWEETEIGSIIDQLLTQLEDVPTMNLDEIRIEKTNKGIVPTDDNLRQGIQEEIADALEMMHELQTYKEVDTFMYLPIIGADGIHRNGGVVKIANRSALTVHETPMDGDTIKALVDKLAPGHLMDQARREQRG